MVASKLPRSGVSVSPIARCGSEQEFDEVPNWRGLGALAPRGVAEPTSWFGRITSPLNRTVGTATARQIQFMLRYIF